MTSLIAVRRTLAILAAVPLLLSGLAACGGDSGTAHDPAGAPAEGAPAAHLEPGDDVDPADFADLLAAGLGSMTTAHVTIRSEMGAGGSMTGEGDADFRGERPAAAMTMTSDLTTGEMEVRLVDDAVYLKLGDLSHGMFWKLDLNDPDSPLGALGSQLDPKSAVGMLEKGLRTVTYVGTEGGLDHYQAAVDPRAVVEGMGAMGDREGMGGMGGMGDLDGTDGHHADALPKSLDYDLWLDEESRVTRLTSTMGDLGSVEMTLSDFGADVSVEAPSADQVTEMPELFDSLSAGPQG